MFNGATELDYSSASIISSNNYVVDRGEATIEADSNVTGASVLDFKKNDGSTNVFSARVVEKTKDALWTLKLMTNGYELNNLYIQTVWTGESPEAIVEDIIDTYTENLTFVSTDTSGITISNYIGDGYAIDIIKDMMDALQWELIIDVNDNVYFQPKGYVNNGVTFTNGTNCTTTGWKEDQNSMVNHIKVIGGFESYRLQETVTGTGTEFTLTKKPQGSMRVTVGGTEVSADDYEVDAEGKTVTFDSSQTDPLFDYSYSRPIIVENQDDNSISTYGEVFQKFPAPWLDTFADARRYAQNVLDTLSSPLKSVNVIYPEINFDVAVGETVTVIDTIRSEEEVLVVNEIVRNAEQSTTTYKCGADLSVFYDWQRGVQERIKKIERRFTNEDEIRFARTLKSNLNIDIAQSYTWQEASPQNTFWLNHKTLSRLRTVANGSIYNFEADCSDNGNNGTWYGTGIDGSQFTETVDSSVLKLDMEDDSSLPTITDLSPELNDGTYKINATAYYPFNGNANDESVNSNDGVVTGATLTTDHLGNTDNAYLFADNTEYISATIGAITQPYTISFWYKPATDATTARDIINLAGAELYPKIQLRSGGRILLYSGAEKYQYSMVDALSVDTWAHVTCVVGGTNTTDLKVYIDGILSAGSTGNNSGTYFDPDTALVMGGVNGAIGQTLSSVLIIPTALTATEVLNLYNVTSVHKLDDPLVTKTDSLGNTITGLESAGKGLGYLTLNTPITMNKDNASLYIEFLSNGLSEGNYANQQQILGDSYFYKNLILGGTSYPLGMKGETNTNEEFFLNQASQVNQNQIYKLLITFDNGIAKTYKDGTLIDTRTIVDNLTLSQMMWYYGGSYASSQGFYGILSKPIIWNRVLNSGERTNLFIEGDISDGFRLGASNLNGTDNYISVANDATLNLTNDISVSFAIKLTSLPSAEKYILSKENATDGYSVRINATNKIEFVYNDTSSNEVFTFDTALTAGAWNYITITKKDTSLKGYIDAVEDTTETMTTSTIGTNTEALLIGSKSTNFTEMQLDELRIYNRELEAFEITNLKNKQHINEGNVLYLSFDNPKLGLNISSRTNI